MPFGGNSQGGGFFGSGASSSASTSQATETGQQASDNASNLSLNFGNLKKSNANVNLTVTDRGAVQAGINAALNATENALLFGGGAFQEASGLIEANNERVFLSLERQSQDRNMAFDSALEFAAGSLQEVSGSIEGAIDVVDRGVERVLAASESARVDALSFAAGGFQLLLDQSLALQKDTLDIIGNTTGNTLSSLAEAQSKTIETIGQQTKSEATQSFDKLVKFAGIAFAGVSLVLLAVRFKG